MTTPALDAFFHRFPDMERAPAGLRPSAAEGTAAESREPLLDRYRRCIASTEERAWAGTPDIPLLELAQALHREMEEVIATAGEDWRHAFVVVIPVADRPAHLRACLESLLEQCRRYGYGGCIDGRYPKISVFIADDSRDPGNIARHREIAAGLDRQGVATRYFGLEEQLETLRRLPPPLLTALAPVVGEADPAAFAHKGAAITRNIACLALSEAYGDRPDTLLFFIDSDQEFSVRFATPDGDREYAVLSYFHQLDAIFSRSGAGMLTGKVVGDPPVSPAVMAGRFLDDVAAFLRRQRELEPTGDCAFHQAAGPIADDAAYHDMAELFGFRREAAPFLYPCDLPGDHDNSACLHGFSRRLSRFFDGEHPTRKTLYTHTDALQNITPARTVYTGNYVFRTEFLSYFIPFAPLRLRMAGPVLGRLVQAREGGRFVSANLPLLHRRTVESIGRAEFRPGVDHGEERIDLGDELVRQYYGDVMLFTVERLIALGYPDAALSREMIRRQLGKTDDEMHGRYRKQREETRRKLDSLRRLVHDPASWWTTHAGTDEVLRLFDRFLENLAHNFGPNAPGYARLDGTAGRQRHLDRLADALARYDDDCRAWRRALGRGADPSPGAGQ